MKSKKFEQMILPQITEIENAIHHRMESPGNLSRFAQYFGNEVLKEVESAKHEITSQKPVPATTPMSLDMLQGLCHKFIALAGNVLSQNKYGGDATGPAAT